MDGLEEGGGVNVIYLDFSKAFDKVEHGVLLHKLKESKVLGKVGVWLARFLDSASRQQAVVVDGSVSGLSPVISGVPQGTVLGPILFLLHISSIAREVSPLTSLKSYVDDTRVQRRVLDSQSDCMTLQSDLQSIYNWAEDVAMVFNGDKFEALRYWPVKSSKPETTYLDPGGKAIEEKSSLRDLGVEMGNWTTVLSCGHLVTKAPSAGWSLLPAISQYRWLGCRTRTSGRGWLSSTCTPRSAGGRGTPSSFYGSWHSSLCLATRLSLCRTPVGAGCHLFTL